MVIYYTRIVTISNPTDNFNPYNIVATTYSLRNSATFQINWADILPIDFKQYKVSFTFQSSPGSYKDITTTIPNKIFSQAKILIDFQGRSYSFDAGTKGHSNLIGMIMKNTNNILSCDYFSNPSKTIDSPNQNNITVSIVNTNTNLPLVDTYTNNVGSNYLAQDMTSWIMILEFIQIA